MANDKDMKTGQNSESDFTESERHDQEKNPRMSKLAVLAFALSITIVALTGLLFLLHPWTVTKLILLMIILAIIILAIYLGYIASDMIKKSKGNLRGKNIAKAGIIISTGLTALLLVLFCFSFSKYIQNVCQKAQFFFIGGALEGFNNELDGYPPSNALDPTGKPYCGAMKLCEALAGQDLMGFHKESVFRSDGMNTEGTTMLYSKELPVYDPNTRKGPFLGLKDTKAYCINEIFLDVGPFDGNNYVTTDVYSKKRHSGRKIGMPILYYKANTSKTAHDVNDPDNSENIYNYKDNHSLLALGVPGKPGKKHPIYENPRIFYEMTMNYKVTTQSRPYRSDSYILLSAGKDGFYGTKDDIASFDLEEWKNK